MLDGAGTKVGVGTERGWGKLKGRKRQKEGLLEMGGVYWKKRQRRGNIKCHKLRLAVM